MKFLNIFKKKTKIDQPESDVIASITYTVDKEKEMFVDINIDDFDEDSLSGLASLVSAISTVKCQLITIKMIKNGFFQEDKVAEYLSFVADVTANTEDYLEDIKTNKDEPFIKPSDMM